MRGLSLSGRGAFLMEYRLPQQHFYRYLQVRPFVRECIPEFKPKSHRFVTALTTPVEAGHLREAWATELGAPVSDELWVEGLSRIQSCSISSRYILIQFKVLHRLHNSKTKLIAFLLPRWNIIVLTRGMHKTTS